MRENSGNCLISTSGLDDFRPQLSSSDKNRRRSRIDDSDSYTSELLASRLKDFRPNQSGLVGSRRKNRKNDNSDPISGVVALDLDWNRLCRDDQPRNSRLNRLANNNDDDDDDDDDFLAADNDISRPGARLSRKSNKDRNDVRGPGSVLSNRSEERSADKQLFNLDDECTSEKSVKNNGRQSMKHPTIVHGEITRPWTPVFALLEHKYIDKKTELGKPKRRGVMIPDGYTYGRPNDERDGGSSEALHGWPTIRTTTLPFKRKERTSQRDFMALNRAAVSAGLVSANDQYEFRATHDVRRKAQSEDKSRSRTRRIPPSMVFGIATRPATPIFDLLEHKYQDKWLQQRRQLELAKRQEEHKQRRSPGNVYETRASLLRTYQNPVDPAPLWQMPKFAKEAKPSLQTFRSANARKSAYGQFDSDKISRKGNFGQGVYEASKN